MAAMAEISKKRSEIDATGTQLAFVHMASEEQARKFFARFGLDQEHRVSDPERNLYKAFSLQRGRLGQLFGLKVWKRELRDRIMRDRKSTRLNSSHLVISYAVFCLKKKKKNIH